MRGLNWCQVGHPNSLKNLSPKNKTLLFRKSPHLFCLKFWSLLGSGGGWRQCRQGQLKFLNSRWGWTSVVCAVLKWTSLHFFLPSKERKLSAFPFMEICKGDLIHYMCPLARQNSFFVPEVRLKEKREEESDGDGTGTHSLSGLPTHCWDPYSTKDTQVTSQYL